MVSADITTPHSPISDRADSFASSVPVDPVFAHRERPVFTDEPFSILFNSPPSFSMGLIGTPFLGSFHRVSISSAEQLLLLTWSQVSTILVSFSLLYLYSRSPPEGPERNICIFAISARLHGVTLPGDHK